MKITDITPFIKEGEWEVTFSIVGLVRAIKEWEKEGLQMNPDFQRGHVWTTEQQVAYLETLFRGGAKNARVIYLNNPFWQSYDTVDGYSDFVCVDGLQRFTAIERFVNNEIPVFGHLLNEYEDKEVFNRMVYQLRVNINSLKTKKAVLEWYLQHNDGGTPHSQEEIARVKTLLKETNF